MAERNKNLATGGLVVFAAVLIGIALVIVGGPGQGRKERHDETRRSDVLRLVNQCFPQDQPIPAELSTEICGDVRLVDPFMDAPYRYERVADDRFIICAAYELPQEQKDMVAWAGMFPSLSHDPQTGCTTFRHSPGVGHRD